MASLIYVQADAGEALYLDGRLIISDKKLAVRDVLRYMHRRGVQVSDLSFANPLANSGWNGGHFPDRFDRLQPYLEHDWETR